MYIYIYTHILCMTIARGSPDPRRRRLCSPRSPRHGRGPPRRQRCVYIVCVCVCNLSLYIYVYMYTYIHIYICIHVYIYIYICII